MFAPPVMQVLSGDRLHLSHGPIDIVLRAWGTADATRAAYAAGWWRFQRILPELCDELPLLRTPMQALVADVVHERQTPTSSHPRHAGGVPSTRRGEGKDAASASDRLERCALQGPVARRMFTACLPFADVFVTPMAAVAGAVADELLAHMAAAAPITRAFVNDGGDIAVRVPDGHTLDVGLAGDFALGDVPALNGRLRIESTSGIGGIATSGARGRSFSLGIADSVTILARNAATADVAATLVANAVDIASPAVERRPACQLDPDSDLGDRLVTVRVGTLLPDEIDTALEHGLARARAYRKRGLIVEAALMLAGHTRVTGVHQLEQSDGTGARETAVTPPEPIEA